MIERETERENGKGGKRANERGIGKRGVDERPKRGG